MSILKLPVGCKVILGGDVVDKLIGILLIIGALAIIFLAPPYMLCVAALMIVASIASMFFA